MGFDHIPQQLPRGSKQRRGTVRFIFELRNPFTLIIDAFLLLHEQLSHSCEFPFSPRLRLHGYKPRYFTISLL
jgi:hypothetical protein